MGIAMTHLDGLIGESGHVYRDQQTIADAYAYAMALWSQKHQNLTRIIRIWQPLWQNCGRFSCSTSA